MIKIMPETKTVPPKPLTRTVMSTTTKATKTVIKLKESQKLFTHPVRHVEKQTTPQRNVILEPMQPIDGLPGTEDRKERIRSQTSSTNQFKTRRNIKNKIGVDLCSTGPEQKQAKTKKAKTKINENKKHSCFDLCIIFLFIFTPAP